MQRDYYAFRCSQLGPMLNELNQATVVLQKSKQISADKRRRDAIRQAQAEVEQAAQKIVEIEPHLVYLCCEAHHSEHTNSIRSVWQKNLAVVDTPWKQDNFDFSKIPSDFGFIPDSSIIRYLPPFCFMLEIPFRLEKPYLSRDECDFYLLDNPLRREKIFKTPMIAATSWKGALRAAMVQQFVEWWCNLDKFISDERQKRKLFVAKRLQLARIFGTEKNVQIDDQEYEHYLDKLGGNHQARWYRRYIRRYVAANGFFAGRLYFYPTFFDKIGLEVINPHSRKDGVARGPILMECVPQGTIGVFMLLYVPFGRLDVREEKKRVEVAADIAILAEGLRAMFLTYGFGAKTSSSFGTAEDTLPGEGKLVLRLKLAQETALSATPNEPLPRYLEAPGRLQSDFRREDGSLKSEEEYRKFIESLGRQYGKKDQQLYEKVRKWWEREEFQSGETTPQGSELQPEPQPTEMPPVNEWKFGTLSELCELVQRVLVQLQNGGAA